MPSANIKLTYRQVIDAGAMTDFEKNIWHFSYEAYRITSQTYNNDGSITTFSGLIAKDARANSLHYTTGVAVSGFVEKLKKNIPHLKDALVQDIAFDNWQFEIIESDILNKSLHKVAILYTTGTFTLHQMIGETMLLSKENVPENGQHKNDDTFMLLLQPGLSIIKYGEFSGINNYV
jgi:hypothetical protein